jgi:hypothetical protein
VVYIFRNYNHYKLCTPTIQRGFSTAPASPNSTTLKVVLHRAAEPLTCEYALKRNLAINLKEDIKVARFDPERNRRLCLLSRAQQQNTVNLLFEAAERQSPWPPLLTVPIIVPQACSGIDRSGSFLLAEQISILCWKPFGLGMVKLAVL